MVLVWSKCWTLVLSHRLSCSNLGHQCSQLKIYSVFIPFSRTWFSGFITWRHQQNLRLHWTTTYHRRPPASPELVAHGGWQVQRLHGWRRPLHQWEGDASDPWERKAPPPGAHINLIYGGGPQIHTQELEDHADFMVLNLTRWLLSGSRRLRLLLSPIGWFHDVAQILYTYRHTVIPCKHTMYIYRQWKTRVHNIPVSYVYGELLHSFKGWEEMVNTFSSCLSCVGWCFNNFTVKE